MKHLLASINQCRHSLIVIGSILLALSACDQDSSIQKQQLENVVSEKITLAYDPQRYTQGLRLYQQHCSSCHGQSAQGAPNWQQKNAQGQYPPPPLNGTGHTWHHSREVLITIIKQGTAAQGGNMPAWQGKLNDQQIDAILYWLQSQWDKEIYQAWYTSHHEGS